MCGLLLYISRKASSWRRNFFPQDIWEFLQKKRKSIFYLCVLSMCRCSFKCNENLMIRAKLFTYGSTWVSLESLSNVWNKIPNASQLKKKHQGSRAKWRARRRNFKSFYPLIAIDTLKSLANKMDGLGVLTSTKWEYWVCSIVRFTETWLQEHISYCDTSAPSVFR